MIDNKLEIKSPQLIGMERRVGKVLVSLIETKKPKNGREGVQPIFDHRDEGKLYRETHSVMAMTLVYPQEGGESKPWVRMVLSEINSNIRTDTLKIIIGKSHTSEGLVDCPIFTPSSGPYADKPIEDSELIIKLVRDAYTGLEDNNLLVSASELKI